MVDIRKGIVMRKDEKGQVITDLHDRFAKARVAILTEYSGLKVEEMRDLRMKLRGTGAELKVIKNTLASKAAEGTALEGVKNYFQGPIAVVFGYNDPIGPVKTVKEFAAKAKDKLKLKVGVIDGKAMQKNDILIVAELPSREVLVSQLLAGMKSPVTGFVFCLKGVLNKLVYTLNGIKEKKETQ